MKRVTLGHGYVIDIDDGGRNLTLKSNVKEYINKDNETQESSTVHGYFGDFEAVMKNYAKVRNVEKITGTITVTELRQILLDTKLEIEEVCKQIQL